MSNDDNNKVDNGSSKVVVKLAVAVVGMFAFGFALVPLYDVFCQVTGLNGKTGGQYTYEAETAEIDESRTITVQFMASNNGAMSWEFRPMVRQVQVHPGELTEVKFYAHNPSGVKMIAQAVPSVAPSQAADFLHKTECFCFSQQALLGHEEIEMPLMFFLDQDIPEEITKLTLSYTLFDITANYADYGTSLSAN